MNFFVGFLTLTSALKLSFALSCFDHENGAVTLLNSTGIKFCSIVSSLRGERPIQVALDENADLIERYNVFFAKQSELYEIDLLCFMETYNFKALGLPNELIFRCICKKDECNVLPKKWSFNRYLANFADSGKLKFD